MESFSLNPNPRSSAVLRKERSAPMAYSCAFVLPGVKINAMIIAMNKYLCLRFRKIVFIVLILVDNKFNHFLATNYSSPRLQDRQTARPQDKYSSKLSSYSSYFNNIAEKLFTSYFQYPVTEQRFVQ
jgi:hypothetical protein